MHRLGKRDKAVIKAFVEQRKAAGLKLDTDGERLDGAWMGGRGIATWEDGKIVFHELGSRSAQTVQRAVRKVAGPFLLGGFNPYRYGDRRACVTCQQDIEYHGRAGWLDRGSGTECLPFRDRGGEIVHPKGKHSPYEN